MTLLLIWLFGWAVSLALMVWANDAMTVFETLLNAGILFALWPLYLWAIARAWRNRDHV